MGDYLTIIQWVSAIFFVSAVGYAVISDVRRMIIPNQLCLLLAFVFLPAAISAGLSLTDMALHVGIGLAVLVFGLGVFALGLMGGGDIKLISAISIWFGWPGVYGFLLFFALFGGLLALLVIILRKIKNLPPFLTSFPWLVGDTGQAEGEGEGQVSRTPTVGMPYGIAIGAAALYLAPHIPVMKQVFQALL